MPSAHLPRAEEFGAPPKYRSAFIIHADKVRDQVLRNQHVRAEKFGEDFGDVGAIVRTIGDMWRDLSDDERTALEEESRKEAAQWRSKHEEWTKSDGCADYRKQLKDAKAALQEDLPGTAEDSAAVASNAKAGDMYGYVCSDSEVDGEEVVDDRGPKDAPVEEPQTEEP